MSDDGFMERPKVEEFDDGSIAVTIDGYIQYAGSAEDARLLANTILQWVENNE